MAQGEGCQLFCKIFLNDLLVNTLIDPGAGITIAEKSIAHKIDPVSGNYEIIAANGTNLELVGQIETSLRIGNLSISKTILVADGLPSSILILGNDILVPHNCKIDYKTKFMYLDGSGPISFNFQGGEPNGQIGRASCRERV